MLGTGEEDRRDLPSPLSVKCFRIQRRGLQAPLRVRKVVIPEQRLGVRIR